MSTLPDGRLIAGSKSFKSLNRRDAEAQRKNWTLLVRINYVGVNLFALRCQSMRSSCE